MKYQSSPDFTHNQDDKVGVLVTNLGTPDAPKKAELKRYLKEFLSDPRVVEVPPLMFHTQDQTNALRDNLQQQYGDNIVVDFAMRYGSPSVDSVVDNMLQQGVRKLVVLPLYPQYCASTTGSTFDAIANSFRKRRWIPELRFITHYHDHNGYIKAVADKMQTHWDKHGRADKLIFSYHPNVTY